MLSIAGEELYSTTYDISAAARAGNSKILIKPLASFGVQLELIAGRECGDPEAEVPSSLSPLVRFHSIHLIHIHAEIATLKHSRPPSERAGF